MAERETGGEHKTEKPTEKRLRDARERGQVPRSRELGMAFVMLAGAASLALLQSHYSLGAERLFRAGLTFDGSALMLEQQALLETFAQAVAAGLWLLAPLFVCVLAAGVAGSLVFGGWTFSPGLLAPKLEKVSPLAGIKRVFGWNGLAELGKAVAKFLLVALVVACTLWALRAELLGLGRLPIETALPRAARLCTVSLLAFSAVLLLIAAVDVPLQWAQHQRRLRMSRQELKDELKETEGKPEVRTRIRSLQQEIAKRRMMEEVPKADVVATNPTHYAVALRYDASSMRAPKVVAKGADLVALNIRNVAKAHGVPLFEHPPLAQALYHTTDLGKEIPPRLYMAVAQVLTYVYQLRAKRSGPPPSRPHIHIEGDQA